MKNYITEYPESYADIYNIYHINENIGINLIDC